MSGHITCHTMLCHHMPCHKTCNMPCHMTYHATPSMPAYVMSIMLCHVMLCHIQCAAPLLVCGHTPSIHCKLADPRNCGHITSTCLLLSFQNCLNKLQEYCDKWQLEINVSKTKVMVLSIGYSHLKDIHIKGETLECVSNYKYMGVMWSRNGNVSKMEKDQIKKKQGMLSLLLSQYFGPTLTISS